MVPLLSNHKALKNKWVYRIKEEDGGCKWYRARLVVKGFAQQKGEDFNEIFSLVVKMQTIHLILGMAAAWDLEFDQLDVKLAFLHGDMELNMEKAEGFIKQGQEHLYCRLKRSLYGLKQALHQWHLKFDNFVILRIGYLIYISRKTNT